jgi:hypothetical protein
MAVGPRAIFVVVDLENLLRSKTLHRRLGGALGAGRVAQREEERHVVTVEHRRVPHLRTSAGAHTHGEEVAGGYLLSYCKLQYRGKGAPEKHKRADPESKLN